MYSHDLEVMSSNPGRVELGVLGTSVLSRTSTKHMIYYRSHVVFLILSPSAECMNETCLSHTFDLDLSY